MDPFTALLMGGSALSGVAGWFGQDKAEKAARKAAAEGERNFNAQADIASGILPEYGERARSEFAPYAASGQASQKMLDDMLGVNGVEAQKLAFANFQSDPGMAESLAAGQNQIEHSRIFKGGGNSGATQKDLYQFGQRAKLGEFHDRQDRLAAGAGRGLTAASGRSDVSRWEGGGLADIALKKGGVGRDTSLNLGQIGADAAMGKANLVGNTINSMAGAGAMGYARNNPSTFGFPTKNGWSTNPASWATTTNRTF